MRVRIEDIAFAGARLAPLVAGYEISGLAAPTFLAFGPTAVVPGPSQFVLLGGVAVVAAAYSGRRRRPA